MSSSFNVNELRKDFPILDEKPYGKTLVYFDNAATSQKPAIVIAAINNYYSQYNANIHRGVHFLSQKASQKYDDTRTLVSEFINAPSEREIIFTQGTTDSINLVSSTYGRKFVKAGDEVLITAMEHHSNIVPWQILCEEKNAHLKVIPINDEGELDITAFRSLVTDRTKFISIVHASNSLGTINPLKEIIEHAHKYDIPVLVDGAQSMAHIDIDVTDLDCDFFAFSAHKLLGPTGVGCLYGKEKYLTEMPPYRGGGEMISSVSFEKTTYNEIPFKFEAGTPNIAGVIGMGAAIEYLRAIDRESARSHEQELLNYGTEQLKAIPGVKIIGTASEKEPVISFVIDKLNALDVGMYLDTLGIAVRTGHHCTEPVMERFEIPGTIRASFLFYNTKEEIDAMIIGINKAIKLLSR